MAQLSRLHLLRKSRASLEFLLIRRSRDIESWRVILIVEIRGPTLK